MTISYSELKRKLRGTGEGDSASAPVKESGILNYLHTTGLVKAVGGGMASVEEDTLNKIIPAMVAAPKVGDVVAVVNTGIYLLVDFADKGGTAICARIEFDENYVYTLPKFTIATEPNDQLSSFNKFPVNNMFTLRAGGFDMKEVVNRYMLFKSIWTEINKARKEKTISERN